MSILGGSRAGPEKRRVLAIVGTRPEAIKLAPLIRALQTDSRHDVAVCATGQHTDMVFPVLDWFAIARDYTLDVMVHQQPLSHLAGRLMTGIHNVMAEVEPDLVLVQGDTTSAFIGALCTYYSYDHFWKNARRTQPIQLAHIEAGLRSGNAYAPYPEELNRKLIGHLSTWHFAPTAESASALAQEGICNHVYVTGNTVIDALIETRRMAAAAGLRPLSHIADDQKIVLITGHRRENYGEGLEEICHAIRTLAIRYAGQNVAFVYPVHLNRHVQGPVHAMLGDIPNVHLIEPLLYPEFVALLARSYLVLTDSGGIQEEAPAFGKPVLVMREVTERPEGITVGTARLVGNRSDRIVAEVSNLLDHPMAYQRMAQAVNPYGDGRATPRIVNILNGASVAENIFISPPSIYQEAA